MKKVLKISLILMTAFCIASCGFDDDDECSLSNIWVDFGLIESGAEGADFKIHVDDGYSIVPVNLNQIDIETFTNDVRVIVNYTVVGEKVVTDGEEQYNAKINSLRKVLYKGVLDITSEIEDSIGNDPIHVKEVWTKDHMLNFQLQYYGNSQIHFINLVKTPGEITEEDLPLELELRHNNNNDLQSYAMSAFVTFDLSDLQLTDRDSLNYIVRATDFDGTEFSYEGVYKY
ncbi:NigD-like C-terminal domain-containing protein [Mangrovibacterium sp.]|uniref:NigD1/NigD2 family lipoprotein n=1 Tax=Mangrovibacterium sp. TaxID=1961364 RepID=UPI0035649621